MRRPTTILFLFVLLLLLLVENVDGCFGLGGCGGGCFTCGGCGCGRLCHARARVASSKTLSTSAKHRARIGGFDADAYKVDPDDAFRLCCAHRRVPPACMEKCTYGTYTKDVLREMFFHADTCPVSATADIHFCASRGKDHTRCCMQNGVAGTAAGARCMVFCEEPNRNATQLDFGYLPCYERFDAMKSCFWHDALRDFGIKLENLPGTAISGDENAAALRAKAFKAAARTGGNGGERRRSSLEDDESLF